MKVRMHLVSPSGDDLYAMSWKAAISIDFPYYDGEKPFVTVAEMEKAFVEAIPKAMKQYEEMLLAKAPK